MGGDESRNTSNQNSLDHGQIADCPIIPNKPLKQSVNSLIGEYMFEIKYRGS